jgi:hypothetical protein
MAPAVENTAVCDQVRESFFSTQLCTTDTDPSVSAGWYK